MAFTAQSTLATCCKGNAHAGYLFKPTVSFEPNLSFGDRAQDLRLFNAAGGSSLVSRLL